MRFLLSFLLFFTFNVCAQDGCFRIAFGSCSNQNKPLEIFQTIAAHDPDAFIFLGDNIYADTKKMCKMRQAYKKLATNPNFQQLKKTTSIYATWDDHDYGQNDAGRHYEKKKQSKKQFLRFLNEPSDSERRTHEGIYTSTYFYLEKKTVQLILLDCRTFRDNLIKYNPTIHGASPFHYTPEYVPYSTEDSTILGAEQWQWLEQELVKPADIRIIASSTQFLTEYNGYEAWANFPHEQKRMISLIAKTQANGVLFISGDVHYAELSKLEMEPYPLYDLTCSGLSEQWKFATSNKYRVGKAIMENHFGIIEFSNCNEQLKISLEVWDKSNTKQLQHIIQLDELRINE